MILISISNVLLFSIPYYLLTIVLAGWGNKDYMIDMYERSLEKDKDEIRSMIGTIKLGELTKLIKDGEENGNKEDPSHELKVKESMAELFRFNTNEEYSDEAVREYRSDVRARYMGRKFRVFISIALTELVQLAPMIILVLTSNFIYGILVSGAIMLADSFIRQGQLYEGADIILGEEKAEVMMTSWGTRLYIANMALLNQMYFFIYIIIFAR